MYILVFSLLTVNFLALAFTIKNLFLPCRRHRLDPEVKNVCISQYYSLMGHYHSRLVNEYNTKFLPDSQETIKLTQYQEFLKKVREKKIIPSDFVNVSAETYPRTQTNSPTPGSPKSDTSVDTQPGGLKKRVIS